jgi:hypothetical protein
LFLRAGSLLIIVKRQQLALNKRARERAAAAGADAPAQEAAGQAKAVDAQAMRTGDVDGEAPAAADDQSSPVDATTTRRKGGKSSSKAK